NAICRAYVGPSGSAVRRIVHRLGKARRSPSGESERKEAMSVRPPARPAPYSNPYLAGVGLGLVLLAAFVIMGRGLGASGAFTSAAAEIATTVSPARAQSSHYFARYLNADGGGRIDWLVVELLGVAIGGFASAALAGRVHR